MFGLTEHHATQPAVRIEALNGYLRTAPEIPIEPSYLDGAKVYATFDHDGRMVAAYSLKKGPGLRYFTFIPPEERSELALQEDECAEISMFWMRPELTPAKRTWVYWRMQIRAHQLRDATWVLVGSRRPSLRDRNRYTYHRRVWSGVNAKSPTRAPHYLDGIERHRLLRRVVFVGFPRMLAVQVAAPLRRALRRLPAHTTVEATRS